MPSAQVEVEPGERLERQGCIEEARGLYREAADAIRQSFGDVWLTRDAAAHVEHLSSRSKRD